MINRLREAASRWIAPAAIMAANDPVQTRRFDAAAGGPRWAHQAPFGRVGAETLSAGMSIRARGRHAYANTAPAHAGVDAWVAALVGTGIRPAPKHADAAVRSLLSRAIGRWSDNADIDGRGSLPSILTSMVLSMVIDGGALLLMINTADGLRLRQIPIDQLDTDLTTDLADGGYIVGGIEFNATGARRRYWIRRYRADSSIMSWEPSQPFDAVDVIHLFRPMGPGDNHGVSWLAPVLLKLSEYDQLSDALLVGQKVAGMFSVIWTDDNEAEGSTDIDLAKVFSEYKLTPGMFVEAPPGKKPVFSAPPQAQQGVEFMAAELRAIAVGIGVPVAQVSGDLREGNFGSQRADLLAFRQRVSQIQYTILEPQLLRPIYRRAVTSLILSGQIDAPDFASRPDDWLDADWIMPVQPWVDPKKDTESAILQVAAGFKARSEVITELGWLPEDVDAAIAADRSRETTLGLSFSTSPSPVSPEDDDDDDA